MVYTHLGNNTYIGDNRDEVPISENAVHTDVNTGDISQYANGQWNIRTYGGRANMLAATWQIERTLNNIGTSYTDIYPTLFEGVPLGIDMTGYTKVGIVLCWNKNGGTGRHDFRIIDNNPSDPKVLLSSELLPNGIETGTKQHYNIQIPSSFKNPEFVGRIKIQAKSDVGTDDPIFYAVWVYLIR